MVAERSDETSLKILHVMRAPLGGLFRHVLDLTHEQIARGHCVGLITDSTTGGTRADDVLAELAPTLALGLTRVPMTRLPSPTDISALAHVIARCRATQPDIVHGHGSKGGLYARLSGIRPGGRAGVRCYTPHGGSFNYKPGTAVATLYMGVEKLLARNTDIFLFESVYIGRRFDTEVGATCALRRVVHNGIGPAETLSVQPDADADDFLYVGELRAAKGIDTFIDALAEVGRRSGRTPTALLVGTGPEEQELAARATACGLAGYVSFVGAMPARQAFTRGRILVVPSRAESLPYIVLEAAGARIPMIATDVGGISEIFGPYRGRLIPCNNAGRLADAMLCELDRGEELRRRRAEELAAFVTPRFSITNMVDAVMDGYDAALAVKGAEKGAAARAMPVASEPPKQAIAASPTADSKRPEYAPRDPAAEPASARKARLVAVAQSMAGQSAVPAFSSIVLVGLVRIVEFMLIALSGMLIYSFYVVPAGYGPNYYVAIALVAALAIAAFQALDINHVNAFRAPVQYGLRLMGGWTFVFLATLAAVFFLKLEDVFSRVWLLGWYWLGLALLLTERGILSIIVHHLTVSGRLDRRTVIVGGGETAEQLLNDLARQKDTDVRIFGFFDDRTDDRSPDVVAGYPKLGTVEDLVEFARHTRIDLIIFTLPITAEGRILEMLRKLWVLPIDIRLAAHSNKLRFRPRFYSYIGSVPVLDVFDKPITDWNVVLKIAFDKIVGTLTLILLSPLFVAVAIAVKATSKGPILFRQKRYGFNNEVIEVYKFRSMYVDQLDPTASTLVTRDDPRVTPVGRFIRKASLDELPQLFNVVFKGNLSLVGPRPHAVHAKAADRQYDEVVDGYFARHRVRPGITGWAQVNGWRGETDRPEKIQRRVEYDLYYIENWSILFDLYILAITPFALAKTENAY